MKTLLKLIAMAGLASLLMTGCSNKELDVEKHVQNEQMANELEGAPAWVMSHPDDEDYIYGIGVAEPIAGDVSFQRTVAIGEARDEIARNIKTKTKNMLKSYKEKTGNIDNTTFDRVVTNVSKQVANEMLIGSTQHKDGWWISKSGRLYILVSMPKENVKTSVLTATKTSFKNDEAVWQKFQSQKAQEELEAELNSQFN